MTNDQSKFNVLRSNVQIGPEALVEYGASGTAEGVTRGHRGTEVNRDDGRVIGGVIGTILVAIAR